MQVDLMNYLKRYWLVLVLTGVISAAIALAVTYFLSPAFEAKATVMITPRNDAVASGAMVSPSQTFSGTQADMIVSRAVIEQTVDELGLDKAKGSTSFLSGLRNFVMKTLAFLRFGFVGSESPRDAAISSLEQRVETDVLENSGMVEIKVTWSDPEAAKAIADEVARQYVDVSRSLDSDDSKSMLKAIEAGFAEREEALAAASSELAEYKESHDISGSYDPVGPSGLTADERAELARLEARVSAAEGDYDYWRDLYQGTQAEGITEAYQIMVLGEASKPVYPAGPDKLLYTAVGFLVGILLGLAAATWMELSNRTVYTPDDVRGILGEGVRVVAAEDDDAEEDVGA